MSWVESAQEPGCDFPLDNLPFGVIETGVARHIAVAIGDKVLDVHACAATGLLPDLSVELRTACHAPHLNSLMAAGSVSWRSLRASLQGLLAADASADIRARVAEWMLPIREAKMVLPAAIGDYTDFYASLHHAMRVGKLFRPDNPLLPNYKHMPIGYHGRASSIVVSGTSVTRPWGQTKPLTADAPIFSPSQSLDYELEVGAYIGPGNPQGQPISRAAAEQHIFGLCLVNDWSARDVQAWEYQPLGPFLGKSFATTVSPWVVTLDALGPYRLERAARGEGDPNLLPYLTGGPARDTFDLTLEVWLQSSAMRARDMAAVRVSRGNLRHLYWSLPQMVVHHSSNGCNLRTGDLLATGTISGPEEGSEGCLLEMKHRSQPLLLPSGETRGFLLDGDEVVMRAYAERAGLPRIGFGECRGRIESARELSAAH